jgi:hypothetical protein
MARGRAQHGFIEQVGDFFGPQRSSLLAARYDCRSRRRTRSAGPIQAPWSGGCAGWSYLVCLLGGLASCGAPAPSAYSPAETDQALAPAKDLRARCYAGTSLERAGKSARLEYQLDVAADGSVKSIPRFVEPEVPALVECVRHRLDELRFPARARDRLNLAFEFRPSALRRPGGTPP